MTARSRFRTQLFSTAITLIVGAFGGNALAQDGSQAAAEALFEEGRDLLEQGKHDEACPKLAESHRIDPATGTLLALALCHEAQGKLATAWAEFKVVEAQAQSAGRQDREQLAREHTQALRLRLSSLVVEVPASVANLAGFELRVDGVAIGPARYGLAVPIDGGEHHVEAVASGKEPWRQTLVVNPESHAVRVAVPSLKAASGPERPPAAAVARPSAAPTPERSSGLRTASYVAGGAGVVALGVGTYLALDAKADYDVAQAGCSDTGCPDSAYRAGEDARAQGDAATVLFVLGGAAAAASAVLWFLSTDDDESGGGTASDSGPRLQRAILGPRGLVLEGRF